VEDCRLLLGDSLAVLPTLEAGSVDSVVTDPPYGQSNEAYDLGVDPAVWRECFRVAKPDAALLCLTGNPTYHRIASSIEAAGWKVRQMWGWVYKDGLITSAYPREGFDRLAPALTPICYASKGKVLLPLEREGEPWQCWRGRNGGGWSDRVREGAALSGRGHWPRSVVCSEGVEGFQFFLLSNGTKKGEGHRGHPNEKPLPLMDWLLGKLPPGGIVLDPFMGSATTGVAALKTGRRFIGIEKEPQYVAIARKRLAEAAGPLFARPGGGP
jgi:DNA modification methylase